MKLALHVLIYVALLASARPVFADCGTIPEQGQTALRQLAEKYASEIRSDNDDQRRAWALRAAEQLAFTVSPEFGSKRADPGRPQSKDGVARKVSGRLCVWDLVNGTTRQLQFGHGEDITGQVFIPVTPTDHLGIVVVPPPPPPPPDDLVKKVAALEARLAQLATENNQLAKAVTELLARPEVTEAILQTYIAAALADLTVNVRVGRAFGHTHSVTAEIGK